MASEALNKYIEKRYDRWLDYAKYHCSLAGMTDEAIDVLNEVMCMLLQKPPEHLSRLMEAKKGKYTELDFYILQMIKLEDIACKAINQCRRCFIGHVGHTVYHNQRSVITSQCADPSQVIITAFSRHTTTAFHL